MYVKKLEIFITKTNLRTAHHKSIRCLCTYIMVPHICTDVEYVRILAMYLSIQWFKVLGTNSCSSSLAL